MIVDRQAVIVSVLGASLAMGSAVRAADTGKAAVDFEGARESLSSVLKDVAGGDLGKASAGLFTLWGSGDVKPRIRKVNLGGDWGGDTGKPPPIDPPRPPRPEPPPRPTPPNQDPRPLPPPLPPTVIPVPPGTTQPA
jgi:hypothetical protein